MIGWRHVHDPAGSDIALGLFDLVADLGFVGALGTLHRLHQNHETVIGVTAEGRNRLSGLLLIGARIIHDDGLLRILGWELVRDE